MVLLNACGEKKATPLLHAQQDTLRKNDSLHVEQLLDESWKWGSKNPDSCRFYAEEAEDMARVKKLPTCEAEAICRYAMLEEDTGGFAIALKHYQQAMTLDSSAHNAHGIGREAYQMGILYKKTGHYELALLYTDRAIATWKNKTGEEVHVGNALTSKGNIYLRMGRFEDAVKSFQQVLDIAMKMGSKSLEADACNSIGRVYEQQKLLQRALDMYQRSFALEQARKNTKGIATACSNIGNIYLRRGVLDTALSWYQESITLKEQIHNTQGTGGTLTNIGLIYEGMGDFKQALVYHLKSYAIQSESGEQQEMAISANNIGLVLLRLGKKQEAIHYLEEALKIARATGGRLLEMEILKSLSEASAASGDYHVAFDYTQQQDEVHKLLDEQMQKAVETEGLYREEQNRRKLAEKENEKQEAELQRKLAIAEKHGITLVALVAGMCLLLLFLFALWRANRQEQRAVIAEQQEKINRQQTEELMRNQELIVLRSMLDAQERERQRIAKDLHDRLGLKLSTARLYYGMVGKHLESLEEEERVHYGQGNQILDEACDELRKVAHNLVSGELMRFGLAKAVNRLCETLSQASGLQIDFYASGLDDRLESQSELQLYQVVQELLTNIHRHARAKKAIVQLTRYNHTLNILVEDDGVGFLTTNEFVPGIGLKNIHERVHKLNGTMQIDSKSGHGTTISIDITIL